MPENYLFTLFLIRIPLLFFYLYAAYTCWKMREVSAQPATLGLVVFGGKLLSFAFSIFLFIRYGLFKAHHQMEGMPFGFRLISIVNIALLILLLIAIFTWRNNEESTYKEAGIFTGIGIGIYFSSQLFIPLFMRFVHFEYEASFYIVPGISIVFTIGMLFCFLKAMFIGRGYQTQPKERDVAKEEEALPATGMFEREDYIPYLCGSIILGGFLVIPIIWGAFWDVDYGDALFSSLISCGIFAFSHDKRGNFLWGRFIGANLYIIFVMMRTMVQARGDVKRPVFLAGGLLGYLVMFACGWAGIWIVRVIRKPFKKEI